MTHADRDHSEHQQLRGSWPDYVAIALGGTTERTAIDRVTGRPATAYTPPEDVIWPADPTVTDEPAGPLAADPGQDHPVQTEGHRRGRDGRYLCCRHCVEDKIHDVPKDGHDGPCSTCDDPGAMTRERLRDAEAEVARLRAELETMGDEWEGLAGHLRRQPMNSLDRREANVWDVAVERLRGILDGPSGAQSPAETPGETTTTTGAGAI